jgi:hypothetical protein
LNLHRRKNYKSRIKVKFVHVLNQVPHHEDLSTA